MLEKNILNFDQDTYTAMMKKFEEEVKLIFDGQASARVADKLEDYMRQ